MERPTSLTFWRLLLAFTGLLTLPALFQIRSLADELGFSLTQPRWSALVAFISLIGIGAFLLLLLSWSRFQSMLPGGDALEKITKLPKIVAFGLLLLSLPVFSGIMLYPSTGFLIGGQAWLRFLAFWLLSLASMFATRNSGKQVDWTLSLAIALLLQAVFFTIAASLSQVSNNPFLPGWSESSRYYDASLLFAQRIYAMKVPLAALHPSLHFLLAVPFIFPGLPLWVHRLWQAVLFLGLNAGTALCLARRLSIPSQYINWLFTAWCFLFLLQGPVYIHLLVPVLIIVIFASPQNHGHTLLAVILASIWAGISRINWFPVPGLLAAVLYLVEVPVLRGSKRLLAYLWKPVSCFLVGTLTSFISQYLYILLSGNLDRQAFFSSLTSDLLWYRLLPNTTYPPGILLGSLIVSLPILLLLFWMIRGRLRSLHPIRWFCISVALGLLFAGGSVVSVKIGGGADLHNMDAFFVLLLILGGYGLLGQVAPDEPEANNTSLNKKIPWSLAGFALLVPLWFAVQSGEPVIRQDMAQDRQVQQQIQTRSMEVVQNGGEVLFISQRHLLAFHLVEGIPLVPDYEKDFLVEMVMSHNKPYLGRFYQDLRQGRFGLIVVDPQTTALLGSRYRFGEENNAWVLKVAIPLLCAYTPLETFPEVRLQLLVPCPDCKSCP